jgi:hypothetical protein
MSPSALRLARACVPALVASISSFASAQYPGSAAPPEEYKKGYDSINKDECKSWIFTIASKDFAGRGTGQPGYQKAADFMAARFKEYGLKPMGDHGTYFQGVPFERRRMDPNASKLTLPGAQVNIKAGSAFIMDRIRDNVDASGDLVYVAASGPGARLDDDSKVQGKIVVANVGGDAVQVRRQLSGAGPAAILYVTTDAISNDYSFGRAATNDGQVRGGPQRGQRAPQGRITVQAAQSLVRGTGGDASIVDPAALSGDRMDVVDAGQQAKLVAKLEVQAVSVPNVVGLLEGSDPTLKAEYVGMGAHLDHLGTQNGTIYYGADDDGSGNTALLAIIRAFSQNPVKPKRSILFMCFCGEEMGLIGSSYYTAHPEVPNDKMVCELQMDMVGRNEESQTDKPEDNLDTTHIVGSKRLSTELHQLVLDANKFVNFKFEYDEEDVYTRSDHYMFAEKGIPIAFIFSGFHPDYHQPSDTPDKINYEKIANTARLYYLIANMAANLDHRLKVDIKG